MGVSVLETSEKCVPNANVKLVESLTVVGVVLYEPVERYGVLFSNAREGQLSSIVASEGMFPASLDSVTKPLALSLQTMVVELACLSMTRPGRDQRALFSVNRETRGWTKLSGSATLVGDCELELKTGQRYVGWLEGDEAVVHEVDSAEVHQWSLPSSERYRLLAVASPERVALLSDERLVVMHERGAVCWWNPPPHAQHLAYAARLDGVFVVGRHQLGFRGLKGEQADVAVEGEFVALDPVGCLALFLTKRGYLVVDCLTGKSRSTTKSPQELGGLPILATAVCFRTRRVAVVLQEPRLRVHSFRLNPW